MKPPWYFECGWWSPWCFLDEWAHRLLGWNGCSSDGHYICRKHDAAVIRHHERITK